MAALLIVACGGEAAAPSIPTPPPTPSAPVLSGLSPSSGPAAGGTSVSISGSSLVTGATVTIGGAAATVTGSSATAITAVTPAHAAGAVDVTVRNPDGQSATLTASFTYLAAPPPAPTLAGVAPSSGPAAGGTAIVLTGTHFDAGATVTVAGAAASVSARSATSITATTPAGAAGTADVTVHNSDGQVATRAAAFTYLAAPPPPPTLVSVSPATGPVAGGSTVTLSGTGFSSPSVTFDGAVATVTGSTPTSIVVVTPPHAAGAVSVGVANGDGQSATLASSFTYTAPVVIPPPAPTSVGPASGPTAGGTTAVVSGSGFDGGATVTVGGTNAPVVTRSASSLTITTPPHAAGSASVVVRNGDGQSGSLPGSFLYVAPPALASLSPVRGPTAGGTAVTLSGSGFVTGASVSFGGSAAPASVVSATSISATAPAHGSGVVDVQVVNPDGQSSTLPASFTYDAPVGVPPVVSGVSPGLGPIAGGTTVTVTGSGFVDGLAVLFGGISGTVVGAVTATSFSAITPTPVSAGPVDVTVVLPGSGLSGTLASGFTYQGPGPSVTAMSVRGGPATGGTITLFAGSGLQAGTRVTFGGIPATGVSYDPVLDRLQATTPASALGPSADTFVDVVLTNPDGQSTTVATKFHYGPPPAPTGLAAVAPATLTTIHRDDTIIITGTDFTAALSPDPRAGLQVNLGGAASILSKTPTQIVITAPKLNPGTYQVVVVNFDGQHAVAPGFVVYPGP